MITDAFDKSEVLFGPKDFYGEKKNLCDKWVYYNLFRGYIWIHAWNIWTWAESQGGGGVAYENGTERLLTADELLDEINMPEVEYEEDGTVWGII